MSFTPTPEQLAIVEFAKNSTENLLISARAGAAKTSTLVLVANALPKTNMLCLAFNKKIADEMKLKLPANCTAMTLNGLGHRAWADSLGKKLSLVNNKCFEILSLEIEKLSASERTDVYENMGFILKSCQHAKSSGHVPNSHAEVRKNTRLMDDQQLIESLEEIPSPLEEALILSTLEKSMDEAFSGRIDFADQLLMPTVFRAIFQPFSLILVDEAQDLSELNHMMLKKLVRKRIIAVGDQAQAIYAFRGAHEEGMAEMKEKFSMTELSLSTTFRCPEIIADHIRWRTPDIRAWEGNPERGSINRLQSWSLSDIPDESAVISRNNAPLFSLAIKLLKSGRYPNLWGNDIGRGLLKVMEKLGPASMRQTHALTALNEWIEAQKKKVKNINNLLDRASCIRVFIEACPTLGEAIHFCEHTLRSQGKVHLMTGHKSKGHEFTNVFFLDQKSVRDEGQDPNLRYVICTRTKANLTYINSQELELPE